MNGKGWGRLITPLKWFGRGALRLIPVIGWAVMAAEIGLFAWEYLGLKDLPWSDWIPDIDWSYWFSFEWLPLLPEWDWSVIIPRFDLAGKLFFGDAPSGLSSDPMERAAAIRRGQSLGYAREVTPVTGARALGGPIKAGLPYLAGERGPEPIFASRDAYVATHSSLLRMNQLAQSVRSAGRGVLSAAALGTPGGLSGGSTGGGPVLSGMRVEIGSISISAPSGVSDPEGLVDAIAQGLGERLAASLDASFSD